MTTMVYKSPGPHELQGEKVDYKVVEDDQIEKALDDGWFRTIPEAVGEVEVPEEFDEPDGFDEPEMPATNVLLDADGLPWDERIHVAAKKRTNTDKWRVKPGISAEVLAKVRAGL